MIQPSKSNSLAGPATTHRLARSIGPILALVMLVTLCWCGYQRLWSVRAWNTPPQYAGDALWGMASTKIMADGEVWPLLSKTPASLGAPFGANWNDYPSTEEGLTTIWALLVRVFGLHLGTNLVLLLGHLLIAVAFYFTCGCFSYSRLFSIVGAFLFAFSHYAFFRGLSHLGLTFYWHIPLGILVAYWCFESPPSWRNRSRLVFCLLVAVLFGGQNPYYSGMFLQFLVLSALLAGLRRRSLRPIWLPFLLCLVVLATFIVMNLDTFYFQYIHGKNPTAVTRRYGELELYALKPIELLLPRWHSITALADWSRLTYYNQAWFLGEAGAPYLGVIAILTGAWLALTVFKTVAFMGKERLPLHPWALLWLLAYSVVGGLGGVFGLTGFILLRSGNRYSIFILAILLLYLVRQLDRWTQSWPPIPRVTLAASLLTLGFFDQVPPFGWYQNPASITRAVSEDKAVASRLQAELPHNAMVFQLPTLDFPEAPLAGTLGPYDLFRPYLQSHGLRFSYGSGKGRPREWWQREVAQLGPADLLESLERYGFSAVLIHRNGYADGGTALQEGFAQNGRAEVLSKTTDYLALRLNPISPAEVPPDFASGWYYLEGGSAQNLRWSSGEAVIIFTNTASLPRSVNLRFALGTLRSRHVRVSFGKSILFEGEIGNGSETVQIEDKIVLSPGENRLIFWTDKPAELPGNGDERQLAFSLLNFKVSRQLQL